MRLPLYQLACGAALVVFALGCGSSSSKDAPAGKYAGQKLNVFNWSDYIDEDLIAQFEKETGAKVQYDNYSSESELENKLSSDGGGYDVIFPSDKSMVALVSKKRLGEIDKEQLSNFKHLDKKFLDAPFDQGNKYSVPYFWGTVAVGINTEHVTKPVKGFEALFDEEYKGRITMLDDAENVVATVMLHLGHPMNSIDDAHLAEVKELLLKQKPLVQAYTSDIYKEKLISGEAWVSLGWSGDILQAAAENENIVAIVPETGTMIWVDSMAIPADSGNVPLAHEFINFLLDPKNAAKNAEYVEYATPNTAALALLDPEARDNPSIYPSEEVIDRCQWLQDRGEAIEKIDKLWREVKE
jgi:spermidine/putrescine transport system substrate-binding protein